MQELFGDVLGKAYLENRVTNVRIQSILELHSAGVGHILYSLVGNNMLIADKKGRLTSYQLNKEYKFKPEQISLADIPAEEIKFLNDTDRILYEYARENGFITIPQVMQIMRITSRQCTHHALNRLMERNLLRKK